MESKKKPWHSKTQWVSLLVAVAGFFPGAGEFVASNPEFVGILVGVVFSLLRISTDSTISLK